MQCMAALLIALRGHPAPYRPVAGTIQVLAGVSAVFDN